MTIIKINGIEVGDFVRVDKEDKCFKGYAVDMRNAFYAVSVFVNESILKEV